MIPKLFLVGALAAMTLITGCQSVSTEHPNPSPTAESGAAHGSPKKPSPER